MWVGLPWFAACTCAGAIEYQGVTYTAISAFALAVLQLRNPSRRACDGWHEVHVHAPGGSPKAATGHDAAASVSASERGAPVRLSELRVACLERMIEAGEV